jgi:hypothetical protein
MTDTDKILLLAVNAFARMALRFGSSTKLLVDSPTVRAAIIRLSPEILRSADREGYSRAIFLSGELLLGSPDNETSAASQRPDMVVREQDYPQELVAVKQALQQ